MKKTILLPKTDTVILCIPEKWIGIPILCKLIPLSSRIATVKEQGKKNEKIIACKKK